MADELYVIPICGCENYSITEDGRIFSDKDNSFVDIKALEIDSCIYSVGKLISATFILGCWNGGYRIRHLDRDKYNNHVNNIECYIRKPIDKTIPDFAKGSCRVYDYPNYYIFPDGTLMNNEGYCPVSDNTSFRLYRDGVGQRYSLTKLLRDHHWKYEPINIDNTDVVPTPKTYEILIPEVPKFYRATRSGKIYNVNRKAFRKINVKCGYNSISIGKSGFSVGRLIASAFLDEPSAEKRVLHINGDQLDDRAENLRWADLKECAEVAYKKRSIKFPGKRVDQIKNGKIIATYASISEASRVTGICRDTIGDICMGRIIKSCPYGWNYTDFEEKPDVNLNEGIPVYDYENYYVFDDGRIYSIISNKYLKQTKKIEGYMRVYLSKNGVQKAYYVHRIVADHFLERPEWCNQVDHLDFDRSNNHVSNLEWVTASENSIRACKRKVTSTKS